MEGMISLDVAKKGKLNLPKKAVSVHPNLRQDLAQIKYSDINVTGKAKTETSFHWQKFLFFFKKAKNKLRKKEER